MTPKLPPRFYADLIGKPFLDGGVGPDFYGCVALTAVIQRRQGRTVPDYPATIAEFHRQFDSTAGILGPCRRIEAAEPGCVVLLRMLDDAPHLGTMIDPYRVFHTTSQLGRATIESLSETIWRRRVLGFYLPEAAL